MAVPEASVDEDHGLKPRQDEIGRARQILPVQPEPIAEAMDDRPDLELGPGALSANLGHHVGKLSSKTRARWIDVLEGSSHLGVSLGDSHQK